MVGRIQKWGNSFAIRIPKSFVEELAWSQNTSIRETIVDGKLIIEAVQEPVFSLDELLEQVTPENVHGEIETGEVVGNEIW